ncbi:MAG TPA: MCE family protein [Nocardioidaceae bacterium]|nr:MCE family protein [Nocardioidaceae bacterium]
MSKPFRERNPVTIGAISLVVIAAMLLAAFKAQDLPLIGGGNTYYAAFTEAGGLKPNDEVRVAGVRVGEVKSIDLQGDHVRVTFLVDSGVRFGRLTGAAIKVKTLLGAMYVALKPAGSGQLQEGSQIPVSRTSSPFDVVQAFSGLAKTSERIDTGQLAKALNTMAALTEHTPASFRSALKGLSELSQNIAARDDQLNTLLTNMQKVSKVVGDRSNDLVTLMRDGSKLFQAVVARRQAIHDLLTSTSRLATQLTGLVQDSRADLGPALQHLNSVVDMLRRNQDNLDNSLRLMAPFYRVFANTLGTGPWFDTFIQNLPPVPQVGGN